MKTVQVLMHYHLDRFVEHVRCRRNHYAALFGLTLLALFCLNAAWLFVAERTLDHSDLAVTASQRPEPASRQGEGRRDSAAAASGLAGDADSALSAFAKQRMVTGSTAAERMRTQGLTVASSTLAPPRGTSVGVSAATSERGQSVPPESLSTLPFANRSRPIAWSSSPQADRATDRSRGLTLPNEAQFVTEDTSAPWELNPPKQVAQPLQPASPYASPRVERNTPMATVSPYKIVGSPTLAEEPPSQLPPEGAVGRETFLTAQVPQTEVAPSPGLAEAAEPSEQASTSSTPESVGVPPPREQPQFLRRNSVLLKPGNYQWEIGLQYTTNETFSPFGQLVEDTSVVANVRQVNRTLTTPIEFRLGIAEGWQGSVGVPIGWSGSETSLLGFEQTDDDFGFGDFAFSLTKVMREGNADRATLLGLLAVTAPTSDATLASTLLEPGATLGRGFWSLTTGVTALKNFDPLVVFGSAGYLHNFEGDVEDSDNTINAGDGFFYRLGVGFAVNSRVSLNTAFSGAFLDDIEFNDVKRGGTSREPLSLRFAATILQADRVRRGNRRAVEPFLNFGLTNSAADSQFGISWTF